MDLTRAIDGKRGWLAAGVALALILSFGIVGFTLATSPGLPAPAQAPPASAVPSVADAPPAHAPAAAEPAPGQPVTMAEQVRAVTDRLQQRGFQATERSSRADRDCVAASYSGTQSYLRAHPCAGVQRALLEVRGAGPGTALVAVCWVRMSNEAGAAALRAVIDRAGSGNVAALERNNLFTGIYYASAQHGAVMSNADAYPLTPGLTEPALKSVVAAAAG